MTKSLRGECHRAVKEQSLKTANYSALSGASPLRNNTAGRSTIIFMFSRLGRVGLHTQLVGSESVDYVSSLVGFNQETNMDLKNKSKANLLMHQQVSRAYRQQGYQWRSELARIGRREASSGDYVKAVEFASKQNFNKKTSELV
ncbi:hypothetical protein RRG08_025116 [Elysia crispata]|uniref:Uncharacterized protein n=1 Tax=Elysia crispata TaxID=231223 RepID=A0AAE1AJJ0_9GAST|nr:hypothetical protein RRG08_025116 [Elysia crispata]